MDNIISNEHFRPFPKELRVVGFCTYITFWILTLASPNRINDIAALWFRRNPQFRRKLLAISLGRFIQVIKWVTTFLMTDCMVTDPGTWLCLGYSMWSTASYSCLKKKKKKANLEFCDFCVNLQTLSLIRLLNTIQIHFSLGWFLGK